MLTKILFTGLVILAVYLFYRARGRGGPSVRKRSAAEVEKPNPIGRIYAYGFIGLLLLVSIGIYVYQYQQGHTVVTIRVIDGNSNNVTIYKAYRKSIKGNRFQSLDGRSVVLGEAERVEFLEDN